jgi:BirA family biotin operon repressor/biotin-[acetyl-CoA-carboxylase] ligase
MVARVPGAFATRAVPGTRFADVRWVAETGSTNRDLLAEAAAGAPEGVVLVADHQTAGRGRLDRTWTAPAGSSLLVSVLLRPPVEPGQAYLVGVAGGVAACDACAEVAGVRPGLKWPNDLVVREGPHTDRKLAGLLAESVVAGTVLRAVVLGMGLNVDWSDGIPADLAGPAPEDRSGAVGAGASSLGQLVDGPVDREALLVAWLRNLDRELELLGTAVGREALAERARERSATVGRSVRVERPDGVLTGRAVGLTPSGALRVEPDGGGPPVEVTVGDVVHLRHRGPAGSSSG